MGWEEGRPIVWANPRGLVRHYGVWTADAGARAAGHLTSSALTENPRQPLTFFPACGGAGAAGDLGQFVAEQGDRQALEPADRRVGSQGCGEVVAVEAVLGVDDLGRGGVGAGHELGPYLWRVGAGCGETLLHVWPAGGACLPERSSSGTESRPSWG
jgi:hypothetical protein